MRTLRPFQYTQFHSINGVIAFGLNISASFASFKLPLCFLYFFFRGNIVSRCLMDRHEHFYRRSCSPEDNALWLGCPYVSSSATMRLTFWVEISHTFLSEDSWNLLQIFKYIWKVQLCFQLLQLVYSSRGYLTSPSDQHFTLANTFLTNTFLTF